MSKKKKKNGYGKGTFVETSMYLSQAFLALGVKGTSPRVSSCSVKILMMLLGKRQYRTLRDRKGNKKTVRSDDNKFTLTYKELESNGINRGNIPRGIDELLAKGFISIVDGGGAFEKHKAVYALEDTYLLWDQKTKSVFNQRKKDVRRGYQNKKSKITTCVDGPTHTCVDVGDLDRGTRALTGVESDKAKVKEAS